MPTAKQPPTWTNDIKKLFTPTDVAHMKPRGYDLSSYDDVKAKSADILGPPKINRCHRGNLGPRRGWIFSRHGSTGASYNSRVIPGEGAGAALMATFDRPWRHQV